MAETSPSRVSYDFVTRAIARTLGNPGKGYYALLLIGRQSYFYWLIPYPNERGLWPNFKSPLIWDEFAIGTYFTVSTVFLIMGLIPDIAAVRDVATGWRKKLYAITALGWRGT